MSELGDLEESQARRSCEGASNDPWGAQGLKEALKCEADGSAGSAHSPIWKF